MYKVFVDSNVVLEHALKRENYLACVELFKLAEDDKIECWCSASTFYVFSYVLRKSFSQPDTIAKLKDYLTFLKVLPTSNEHLNMALGSSFKDVEDAFQYYTALNKTNYFITLNKRDFEEHALPLLNVYTPKEFLDFLL